MKLKIERGKVRTIVCWVLLTVVIAATVSEVVRIYHEPSPEEKRAQALQALIELLPVALDETSPETLNEILIKVLSDGQYDENYLLQDLKGNNPEILMQYFRPIEVQILDANSTRLLARIGGMGMLIKNYIITSPYPFSFLFDPRIRMAIYEGILKMQVRVLADENQDEHWKFEPIKMPIVYFGKNVVVLERERPFMFPTPDEFPFRLGRIEDLNLNGSQSVLSGIGSFLGTESGILHPYRGTSELVRKDQGVIVFSAPVIESDFGGPVFALRDGEFELVGLVQFGIEGKVRAIGLNTIFEELQQAGLRMSVKFEE